MLLAGVRLPRSMRGCTRCGCTTAGRWRTRSRVAGAPWRPARSSPWAGAARRPTRSRSPCSLVAVRPPRAGEGWVIRLVVWFRLLAACATSARRLPCTQCARTERWRFLGRDRHGFRAHPRTERARSSSGSRSARIPCRSTHRTRAEPGNPTNRPAWGHERLRRGSVAAGVRFPRQNPRPGQRTGRTAQLDALASLGGRTSTNGQGERDERGTNGARPRQRPRSGPRCASNRTSDRPEPAPAPARP